MIILLYEFFLIITGKQKNIQEKKRTVTMEEQLYRSYSQYLKDKYHAKVYKTSGQSSRDMPEQRGRQRLHVLFGKRHRV